MSTAFSQGIYPPAPILNVRLSSPDERSTLPTLSALIDTGSDFTLVPLRHIRAMMPPESRLARVRGMFEEFQTVTIYYVDLHFSIGKLIAVEVVGVEDMNEFDGIEIILRRNVLNRLHLFFDGPERQTYLLERKPLQF